MQLRDALVHAVGELRSKGVIIDLTALDILDSYATRTLRDTVRMIRLRGAETVIVGMQPEVAFTIVELGVFLEGITTALDLEEGLVYLNKKTGKRPSKAHHGGA